MIIVVGIIIKIIVRRLSLKSNSSSRHQKQFVPSLEKAANLLRWLFYLSFYWQFFIRIFIGNFLLTNFSRWLFYFIFLLFLFATFHWATCRGGFLFQLICPMKSAMCAGINAQNYIYWHKCSKSQKDV